MISPNAPIFFQPNRVWRCYTGGVLLDRFTGRPEQGDGHFPEDWLASTVRALNGKNSQGDEEGLSRTRTVTGAAGSLLRDVLLHDPIAYLGQRRDDGLGILCKFLDSAVRLPIQCHPDREFALEYYKSDHGKAESWVVLGTREINGQQPYLLMGFQPGVTADDFARVVAEQDIPAMEQMLHRITVKPGDTFFIPGRFPHAIGPGVMMLEVQEPSDWVVQPERYCADTELTPEDMWGPLEPNIGLACFEYNGQSVAKTLTRCRRSATPVRIESGGQLDAVIGPETTPCFSIHRLHVTDSFTLRKFAPYYLAVVTKGCGTITWSTGESIDIQQGDVFFEPYSISEMEYCMKNDSLDIILCSR
ncbi:MAG TPA: mannose-6-phosphate isomerase [Armatimonadota bacterium]|nr:mannose-6-phosphate isomerase [Armatimonadota bacterium]